MSVKEENVRHIVAMSGGKDSAALAVYLKDRIPNLEYVFLDTGHELPETDEYLNRMQAVLGITITKLRSKRDFDFFLKIFKGCLPSPQNRWCTRELKIRPYEKFIGKDKAISYIALRADEDRTGYIALKGNIIPMYPFIEDEIIKQDVFEILEEVGLGLPGYYSWRSRSGCYFCFFQRRQEWIALHDLHNEPPEMLFDRACAYESNHADGRTYTWIQGMSLKELIAKRDQILINSQSQDKSKSSSRKKKLTESLADLQFSLPEESVLNVEGTELAKHVDEEENKPCLICTL